MHRSEAFLHLEAAGGGLILGFCLTDWLRVISISQWSLPSAPILFCLLIASPVTAFTVCFISVAINKCGAIM